MGLFFRLNQILVDSFLLLSSGNEEERIYILNQGIHIIVISIYVILTISESLMVFMLLVDLIACISN